MTVAFVLQAHSRQRSQALAALGWPQPKQGVIHQCKPSPAYSARGKCHHPLQPAGLPVIPSPHLPALLPAGHPLPALLPGLQPRSRLAGGSAAAAVPPQGTPSPLLLRPSWAQQPLRTQAVRTLRQDIQGVATMTTMCGDSFEQCTRNQLVAGGCARSYTAGRSFKSETEECRRPACCQIGSASTHAVQLHKQRIKQLVQRIHPLVCVCG